MKIAVNCQTLVKDKMEGLGWFTYETLKRITQQHPEHEFTFIFGKGIHNNFIFADNIKAVNIGPSFFRPLAWWLKFEFLLPHFVNKENFDLYFSTDGWSSKKIKTKKLIVIHDLNFIHFPKFINKSFYWYYKKFFEKWIHSADEIITVSGYSKSDIKNIYSINENKIHVAHNGCNSVFKPVSKSDQELIKKTYTNGNNFFLFIGALHPRKNIINLIKAFNQYKTNFKSQTKLLIIGEAFLNSKKFNIEYNKLAHKDDIIFAGRIFLNDLRLILGSALALSYISLFEGFGIPIIEAMNCDTPVITSTTTSMPEIAKDAALLVDPYSIDEIANAMHKIESDENLRNELIQKGRIRKNDFSWDKSANTQWDIIKQFL